MLLQKLSSTTLDAVGTNEGVFVHLCIALQLQKQACECSANQLHDEESLLGSADSGLAGSYCFTTQSQRIPQDLHTHSCDKAKAPAWNIFGLLLFCACAHL